MSRKRKPPPKPCAMCNAADAVQDEKYCKACRRVVLDELKKAGYLTETKEPRVSEQRGRSQRDTRVIGGAPKIDWDDND